MFQRAHRHPILTLIVCSVLLLVGFGLFRFIDWTGGKPNLIPSRETTYVLGPIDAEGYIQYDVALNEIMSKGITPETNANVLLWQALGPTPGKSQGMPTGYFEVLGMAEPSSDGETIVDLQSWYEAKDEGPPWAVSGLEDEADRLKSEPWKVADHPIIAAWLRANEKPLAIAVEAIARPDYFNPIVAPKGGTLIESILPNVQAFRTIVKLLLIRAMYRLEQGDVDAAWSDIYACHHLARHVGNGTTLIESLVGYSIEEQASKGSIRLLQSDMLTTSKLKEYLDDLEQLRPYSTPTKMFDVGTRLMTLSMMQSIHRRQLIDLGDGVVFERTQLGLDLSLMLRSLNEWIDQGIPFTRVDLNSNKQIDWVDQEVEIDKRIVPRSSVVIGYGQYLLGVHGRSVNMAKIIYNLMVPGSLRIGNYLAAIETTRIEQLAFRLALHHHETGHYPEQLDAIAPKGLSTIDLLSGKPLIYERTEEGYILYSVGRNGKDHARNPDEKWSSDDIAVVVPIPEPEEMPETEFPFGEDFPMDEDKQ